MRGHIVMSTALDFRPHLCLGHIYCLVHYLHAHVKDGLARGYLLVVVLFSGRPDLTPFVVSLDDAPVSCQMLPPIALSCLFVQSHSMARLSPWAYCGLVTFIMGFFQFHAKSANSLGVKTTVTAAVVVVRLRSAPDCRVL